jgi:ribosomal protein S18 acetylase RimI-like enzyme
MMEIRLHSTDRAPLRPLFELAEDSRAQLDAYIEAGRVLVARTADGPIGHLQLVEAPHGGWEIKNMAVRPADQGHGVGRALVAAAIEEIGDDPGTTITVATAAADVGNLRFYQRLGFRITGVEPDAFTPADGYPVGTRIDGIELRDRVWLALVLPTDESLYRRGQRSLLASWEAYARGTAGAAVRRLPGVAAAVFPHDPERGVYNNAVLAEGLDAAARAAAVGAMEAAYAAAGVAGFAAWVREGDAAMRRDLEARGYTVAETTRAMGMSLAELRVAEPGIDAEPWTWPDYLRTFDLPARLLATADRAAFRLVVARVDGEPVAAGLTLDCDRDCGIYNVGTVEPMRRRGIATALTARILHDARARGCVTATLQSTPAAEGVYAAAGFRDVGRILEYAPRGGASSTPIGR